MTDRTFDSPISSVMLQAPQTLRNSNDMANPEELNYSHANYNSSRSESFSQFPICWSAANNTNQNAPANYAYIRQPFTSFPPNTIGSISSRPLIHSGETLDKDMSNDVILVDLENQPLLCRENTRENTSLTEKPKEDLMKLRSQNTIYRILMSTPEGRFVMKCYDFEEDEERYKKFLREKNKPAFCIKTVARLVIFHEIEQTVFQAISRERFEELAISAAALFPRFIKERFYTLPGKEGNAHGAFQSFYSTYRETAIGINLLPASSIRKRSAPRILETKYTDDFEELRLPSNIIDANLKMKWKNQAVSERRNFFARSKLPEIFSTFPVLRNPMGYFLIQEDFNTYFAKSNDLFVKNWPAYAKKIITLAQSKKTDIDIRNILKENALLLEDDKNLQVLALVLLPFVFNKISKRTSKSKTGKAWNPEKSTVLENFIFHLKEDANLSDGLHKVHEKLLLLHSEQKLCLQPYTVIAGPQLDRITSCHVILGDHTYQVSDVFTAVNVCFQSVKVFHENFPHISNHVWQFIEREIYKFDVKQLYGTVATLIDKLNRL